MTKARNEHDIFGTQAENFTSNLINFKGLYMFADMIPPSYADLGKKARDLFSKGYSMYYRADKFFLNIIIIIGLP